MLLIFFDLFKGEFLKILAGGHFSVVNLLIGVAISKAEETA